MTKKILIDEAVVKQAIWTLERLGEASDTDVSPKKWYEARGWPTLEALEAVIADQKAAQANNKGVNALAEPLTLDDLKVLRKAARCLQWAIQTESFLEKVAPGGHSNEEDYGDAAEGLKRICEKHSITPQTAEQDLAELIDALKKFRGLPPHNSMSNPCQGDGYFYAGIEAKYTPEQIAAANVALDTSTKPAQQGCMRCNTPMKQAAEPVVCDKDSRGCWNVRCQLGGVCKNIHPAPTNQGE